MELRPYQLAAVEAAYDFLQTRDGNPLIVLPTGAGKSLVLARIAQDAVARWNGRVLLLTHVRELITQNADKLRRLCPEIPVGIYSAGLKRRDTRQSIICAGIQSVHARALELGSFDLILIDEAHLLSDREDSMYGQFLADMRELQPEFRLVGLTATPFRLDSGSICGPGRMFADICYEVGIRELIAEGFLSPLVSKTGAVQANTERLHQRGGDFVAGEIEALMDDDSLVRAACTEVVSLTHDRKAVLIFASGLAHGKHVCRVLWNEHRLACGFVSGATPDGERDRILARFRRERQHLFDDEPPLRFLCNVNVLTTGFDAPHVDCVVLLRPTLSTGLFAQMVGRGFRRAPGKHDCLVLDYGGNLARHGPVDELRRAEESTTSSTGVPPVKLCPGCRQLVPLASTHCPHCGGEFPPPERHRHAAQAAAVGVLAGQISETAYDVLEVIYSVHTRKDATPDTPRTMRVSYRLGLGYWVSEWICFEHRGFARKKAERWWRQRTHHPPPDTADEAVDLAQRGALATPLEVTVRHVAGERFGRIAACAVGPRPETILSPPCSLPDF